MAKYVEICNDIKKKIERHEYKDNQPIPSENDLCEIYGVSRVTVRKAIDTLESSGFVYRIKGKGCFVRENANHKLSHIHSFTEAVLHQGMTPAKKQLSLSQAPADKSLADQLHLAAEDNVYTIKCLYYADGTPYCVNTSYLPASLFPNLDYFDFNRQSLYEILRNFYHLNISRVEQTISSVKGSEDICALLDLPASHPLLRIRAISYCMDKNQETAFESYDSYIRTDIMEYHVEKFS